MAIMAYFFAFILVNGLLVLHTTPAEASRFHGLEVVSHVQRPVRPGPSSPEPNTTQHTREPLPSAVPPPI